MNEHPTTQLPKTPDLQPLPSTAAKLWSMVSLLLTLAGISLMGIGGVMYLTQMIEAGKPPPARIIQVTVDPNPVSTATLSPSPTPDAVSVAAAPIDRPETDRGIENHLSDTVASAAQADIVPNVSPTAPTVELEITETAPPTVELEPTEPAPTATSLPAAEESTPVDETLSLAENPLVVVEEETAPPVEAEAPPAPPTPQTTDGTRLTRIVAESIGLDSEVVEVGWTQITEYGVTSNVWVVADYVAGWHKNSALPGQGGNIVLSGHHNIKGEIFRYIVDLEPGAIITLYDQAGQTFNYFVEDKFIVKDKGEPEAIRRENAKWIGPFNEERLTLVTCWPYTNNTHRVIVIAKPLGEAQAGN
ncbi:MAG: sortase [Anaerolineae bacterium]|nr:sortase [Anaerolineae bacterium]